MKKIRCILVGIALFVSLSGLLPPGSGLMANTASSRHVSSAQLTKSFAFKLHPPCPIPGTLDC